MFANFIYFIVALLIYSTYQPSEQTNFPPLDTALFFISLLLLFTIFSKRQFTRIAASIHTSTPDELDRRFSSTLTRQSVLAVAMFAVDVYGLNLSSFFRRHLALPGDSHGGSTDLPGTFLRLSGPGLVQCLRCLPAHLWRRIESPGPM
jgi:hypothetical protein